MVRHQVSNVQSYLYQIVSSIQNGSVSSDLAAKKPGEIEPCQVDNACISLLSFVCCCGKKAYNFNLSIIVNFIVNIYAQMLFKIKSNASIIDGSRNFFVFIKLIQNLDPFVLDII